MAPPSRLEDLFALAYHAWCLGASADDEDQHVHLCRPGNTRDSRPPFKENLHLPRVISARVSK